MSKKIHLLFICLLVSLQTFFSQENIIHQKGIEFSVKISVVDKQTNSTIKNAEIYVNGITYSFPDINGKHIVKARVGDQLRVSHPDFETVYYTIKSNEDIKVLVEGFIENRRYKLKSISKRNKIDFYYQHLDSAKFYQQKDIDKSISFIEKALKNKESKKRNLSLIHI